MEMEKVKNLRISTRKMGCKLQEHKYKKNVLTPHNTVRTGGEKAFKIHTLKAMRRDANVSMNVFIIIIYRSCQATYNTQISHLAY